MSAKKTELLAPAGGVPQLVAAVENGADAVYLGGDLFNARMNAGNFSMDQIRKAVLFAHKRNVDIHVTMNTLLKDDELEPALAYAEKLYEAGVDALIVQDLGLAGILRKNLPEMALHMSTQATCSDLRTVKAAMDMGYSRVVLARELSLEEIREICEVGPEIEVFAHGALCICYSGQCQLSRFYGDRSGNRGTCAQPCRLAYQTLTSQDGDEKKKFMDYPLSPKDLCLADHLGELVEAGVTSFKIEGRMKSPEYVGTVTRIYRKYLDKALDGQHLSRGISPEDRMELMQIFNRGNFTDAYLKGTSGEELMSGTIPKNQGIYIGRVKRTVPGKKLVEIEVKDSLDIQAQNGRSEGNNPVTWPLQVGDGIEIRTRDGKRAGGVISYCRLPESGKNTGSQERLVRIGDIKDPVREGDSVYRTSSSEQLKVIGRSFKDKDLDSGRYLRQCPVDMVLSEKNGMLELEMIHCRGIRASVSSGQENFEKGKEGDLAARSIKAFGKTGGTPYKLGNFTCLASHDLKVPMSLLNGLRRDCISALDKAFEDKMNERGSQLEIARNSRNYSIKSNINHEPDEAPGTAELYYWDWETFYSHAEKNTGMVMEKYGLPVRHIIPVNLWEENFSQLPGTEADWGNIIPYISNVPRGKENQFVEDNIESIIGHLRIRKSGIYIGTLGWLDCFKKAGITVYGDYGLNAFNEEEVLFLKEMGMDEVAPGLENANPSWAAYPLMTMEHHADGEGLRRKTPIRSRTTPDLRIIRRSHSDQTLIIPDIKDIQLPPADELAVPGFDSFRIYMAPGVRLTV